METGEISIQEVKVFVALYANKDRWLSNHDVHKLVGGVAPRTVRQTTLKLVNCGLLDQAEIFPGHRYRLAQHAIKRNKGYFDRLRRAAEALEIPLEV